MRRNSMKILFIEDEKNKAEQIISLLKGTIKDVNIVERNSYTSGILEIRKQQYDFILLDMSLPLYDVSNDDINDQNDFETFAGIDILDEIKRIKVKCKVIVITAFDMLGDGDNQVNLDQLNKKMQEDYSGVYQGVIHYNVTSFEWRKMLLAHIQEMI